ncbi:MAG: PTS sugar transporter subunit IIA [Rhodoglobus sp.]
MSKVLELNQIKAAGTARTKEEALAEAAEILISAGAVSPEYLDYMKAREELTSTFMGNFLAIPHGTNEGKDTILSSALSFVRYADPLDWDGNEVRFVVGIAGKDGGHMDTLAAVATIFSDNDEVQKLIDASSEDDLMALLSELNNA